jgi:D-glycero-alpha-D-manno-heptose-7-phosphate kinase
MRNSNKISQIGISMIITRAPFRLSFVGGGTDLEEWIRLYGYGQVVSSTFDKFSYCLINERGNFFEKKFRILSAKNEIVDKKDEISNPFIREALKYFQIDSGLELNYNGDLPGKSGLGSSASLGSSIIQGISVQNKLKLDQFKIYKVFNDIEKKVLKGNMGYQDQASIIFGGLRFFKFTNSGNVETKIIGSMKDLESISKYLWIVYTGKQRISEPYSQNLGNNITSLDKRTIKALEKNLQLVSTFVSEIKNENFDFIGEAFNESWENKCSANPTAIDSEIYELRELLLGLGVNGIKLMGAGGGGFLALYLNPEKIIPVQTKLSQLGISLIKINLISTGVQQIS